MDILKYIASALFKEAPPLLPCNIVILICLVSGHVTCLVKF